MPNIVGLLLAAGKGTRFGGDKLRAMIPHGGDDARVGARAASNLIEAIPESIAIVRPDDHGLAEDFAARGLRIVKCDNASDGMGASLACGVRASRDAAGWIVALADMPWIAAASIGAVKAAIEAGAQIAAPMYRGMRGHPVGFSNAHYTELSTLTGDAGARSILERHRSAITLIDVNDAGILQDNDTPDALQRPA
jgi:molybdenum cofactor cytidylyltransferase